MHSLLRRQLKRCFGTTAIPDGVRAFVEVVDLAYSEFDDDRVTLERSLDLSSTELLQSNGDMRAVFQAFPDLFFRLDDVGVILDVKGDDRDLVIPAPKLIGRRFGGGLQAASARAVADAIREVRASQAPTRIEYPLTVRDVECTFEARFVPLVDTHVIVIVRNITQRRKAELELRQAQKIDAVGRLAGGVAHDFNNILGVILGYTELLKVQVAASDPRSDKLEQIHRAAQRAAGLTRQLLAFSRRQVLEPKILDLNVVVGEMEKMLRRLIGEDISFVSVREREIWSVRADPGQMEQVIMNLVINARDAMPHGGQLTITTANTMIDGAAARVHPGMRPGPHVVISVTDTGCGMSAETIAQVFEPFYTTKEVGKGTGLGLSTVYGIVKQSEGHISVHSEPGNGTTFEIFFPRVIADNESVRTGAPRTAAEIHGTETVLVIEDDSALRAMLHELLTEAGHTILEARNGEEALAWARTHQGPIDLVLSDVIMPGISGPEAVNGLRTLRPQAKVLFMSGYTDEAIVHHGVLDPGVQFLQKPFSSLALLRKMRDVLDQASHVAA